MDERKEAFISELFAMIPQDTLELVHLGESPQENTTGIILEFEL